MKKWITMVAFDPQKWVNLWVKLLSPPDRDESNFVSDVTIISLILNISFIHHNQILTA